MVCQLVEQRVKDLNKHLQKGGKKTFTTSAISVIFFVKQHVFVIVVLLVLAYESLLVVLIPCPDALETVTYENECMNINISRTAVAAGTTV